MTHALILLTLAFPIVLVAVILALSARTRRGIVFGVTLPLQVADSPQVHAAITRYRRILLLTTLALLTITFALAMHGDMRAAAIFHAAAVFALIALALILRAKEAQRLRSAAIDAPLTRTADLAVPSTTYALALTAAPLLLLAATALWLKAHWLQIPARWPRYWNASGQANGWSDRSFAGIFFPIFMGIGITLLFLLINAFNTKAPGPQAVQRARFAAPLAAMSWVMALIFCVLSLMPLYHLGLAVLFITIPVSMLAMLGVIGWSLARAGFFQTGSSAWTAQPYDGTPDRSWKAGIIYINRNDPAVVVPKRFGYGWTLNFGRPIAWLFMACILLFALASILAPHLLHRH